MSRKCDHKLSQPRSLKTHLRFSSLTTLTGYTLPSIFRSPPPEGQNYAPYVYEKTAHLIEEYTLPQIRAVLQEMLYLARAMGFPDEPLPKGIPSSIVEDTIEGTRQLHQIPESTHKPSMMLDAENGRPLEVEVRTFCCILMDIILY